MNRGDEDDRGPWILHNEVQQPNGRRFFLQGRKGYTWVLMARCYRSFSINQLQL